jgi:DNA-directed RNA polymerase specialized sigma24 family protein
VAASLRCAEGGSWQAGTPLQAQAVRDRREHEDPAHSGEAAATLGVPRGTVMSRLAHAARRSFNRLAPVAA